MNDFAAAEMASEAASVAEFGEVGQVAVDGPVSVEFIGFEALPEIQTAPEAQITPDNQLTAGAESAPPALSTGSVAPITAYLESIPALEIPAAQFTLTPPEDGVTDHPEPDDSPAPRLRKGTHAHIANQWELAA